MGEAREPFRFYTRLNLSELTGLKASTLEELAALVKRVPASCIYHHTHRYLQQHQSISPEPPNDFAYWAAGSLGDGLLGERLASIDTVQHSTIRGLRAKIAATIDRHLERDPHAQRRFAREGEEFRFIKSISFVFPTAYEARDLAEFVEVLRKITVDSIYFHVFEARLRLERGTNDFSYWIESSVGDPELARAISRLDPYTRTLEGLRATIIDLVESRIREGHGAAG